MKKNLLLIFLILLFITGCGKGKEVEIEVKEIVYECEEGYTLNYDKRCEKSTVIPANINYTCPEGYYLNGNICQREDLKTVEIGNPVCEVGYEYDSWRNVCMSTKTVPSYYEYNCPNNSIEYNKACYVYLSDDPIYGNNPYAICIYGTVTSVGIINPTNYCRYYSVLNMIQSAPKCPSGYTFLRDNTCTSTEWKKIDLELNCPIGYVKKDEYLCSKIFTVEANINYTCPDGYTLGKEMCSKTEYMEAKIK